MHASCCVQGLFAVARKFYLLFQQHTTDDFNKQKQEYLVSGWGPRGLCWGNAIGMQGVPALEAQPAPCVAPAATLFLPGPLPVPVPRRPTTAREFLGGGRPALLFCLCCCTTQDVLFLAF